MAAKQMIRKIDYCEFYITNVCNLACQGCNRFNNYKFTGYQRWIDYQDTYQRWSKELQIGSCAILGGEPLLNPDIIKWISGISELWPRTMIRIITNGYHLNKVQGLYELLEKNKKIQLWVGIHNKKNKKEIMTKIEQLLTAPLRYEFDNSKKYQQCIWITDSNNVKIKIEYNWWFHQGALIKQDNGFTLHNSDAEKSHTNCHMKTCHHMVRGKLYKCGVVALLPEFAEQHPVTLSPSDNNLMHSYRALDIADTDELKDSFINNLKNSIPQCKFCPEVYIGDQIFAEEKKLLK